jgi:hypothetical protein
VTIHWSESAVRRAGLTDADLLALTVEPAPVDADVVQSWFDNLKATPATSPEVAPRILFTSQHIKRYAQQHAEMFGTRPTS